jgi:hypothetical protein
MELEIYNNENHNQPNIVFTRYLYIKQEVKLALLASLLNKSEDALFWAYELYHSGFIYELIEFIFKVYYDFYAMLNEPLETYLIKKSKDILKKYNDTNCNNVKNVGSIIRTLLQRPYNTDVFMLHTICNLFDVENNDTSNLNDTQLRSLIENWIEENKYLEIANFILNDKYDFLKTYNIVLDTFSKNELSCINKTKQTANLLRNKTIYVDSNKVLLAKVMDLFARKNGLIPGKNKYAQFELDETILYETLESKKDNIKNYKILYHACKLGIDDQKYLSLFRLHRTHLSKSELFSMYNNNWDYYASWAPFWGDKICACKGIYDHVNKKIIFDDEHLFDQFHNTFDYEPDEQPMIVKNKSLMTIEDKIKWPEFYQRHKNCHLFELDEDMLLELEDTKISY